MPEPISIPRHDPTDAASYIASMSSDLAAMARRHGLETLGYLLEMARLEAENTAGIVRMIEKD